MSPSPSAAPLPRPTDVNRVPAGIIFHELFEGNRTGGTVHVESLLPCYHSLQVTGVNGSPLVWSVTLEGSQNGEDWWVILTHNSGTYSDGTPIFPADAIARPYCKLRLVMAELNLGSATGIRAVAVCSAPS